MTSLIAAFHQYEEVEHDLSHRAVEILKAFTADRALTDVIAQLQLEPSEVIAGFLWGTMPTNLSPSLALHKGKAISPSLVKCLSPDEIGMALHTTKKERYALSAGLLQAADLWEASHKAAQEIETGPGSQLGAWWHAIAHRREPDAFNANYWVRRAGHWPEIANGVVVELATFADRDRFIKHWKWQPEAFFTAVAQCKLGSGEDRVLRQWQRIEILGLLEATWQSIVS